MRGHRTPTRAARAAVDLRAPGRPLSLASGLLHDCGGAAIFAQRKFGCTVTWPLTTLQLRAGTPWQGAPHCRCAVRCASPRCPRPARSGTRAHPALAVWPLVRLQCAVLDFPLAYDYDPWLSTCARTTVRMVECSFRRNAPAEAIAVHATSNTAHTICNVLKKYVRCAASCVR